MNGVVDRLTARPATELDQLAKSVAADLTFNELLALAGQRLAAAETTNDGDRDAGRDLSLAHTALEDALTRYNSASYRIAGTWKRADPDLT